ncbi:MAG: hypothetical protein LBD31_02385, partial [Treponema sp.]|nr:hypothetical protein [Treponema sp.]
LSSQPAGITDSSRLNPASSLPIPSAYQCFYVLLSKRLWGSRRIQPISRLLAGRVPNFFQFTLFGVF